MDGGGLLFTGLYWEGDRPKLTGLMGDREHGRPLKLGETIGWEVMGPRRCIGLYDRRERRRRRCPVEGLVAEGSQCDVCRQADPGRLVARGQLPEGMDQEPFVLYLAWFGEGLSKVGITAEERGVERLCEQAALSWCLVARGPFAVVRRAEMLVASLGVAPERVTTRTKQAAWWWIPPAARREAELAGLHGVAVEAIRTVHELEVVEFRAIDLTHRFGLEQSLPGRYELVNRVRQGAVLQGTVSHVIGRSIVLSPAPLAIDARILEGWTLRRSSQPIGGLDFEVRSRETDARAVQGTLF